MRSRFAFILLAVLALGCGAPGWPAERPLEPDDVRLEVTPTDPIAGEHVRLVVPVVSDDDCSSYGGRVVDTRVEDGVTIHVIHGAEAHCPIAAVSGAGESVVLGPLAAGPHRVVLEDGGREVAFEVRPEGSDPGPPPRWFVLARAVHEATGFGHGCSGPLGEPPHTTPWRERDPRLYAQVAHAHPTWSSQELETALCVAQSISIREVSPTDVRYRYERGSLCRVEVYVGRIVIDAEGRPHVEPPHLVEAQDVAC